MDTSHIEMAATKFSDPQANLTRAAAIRLLLQHEISHVSSAQYRAWLDRLFDPHEKYGTSDPGKLSDLAAAEANENPGNFSRPGQKRDQALAALAAQIVAHCLTERQLGPAPTPRPHRGRVRRGQLVLASLATVVVVSSLALFVWDSRDRGGPQSPNSAEGSALKPDILKVRANDGNWSFAFAQEQKPQIAEFLQRADRNEPYANPLDYDARDKFLNAALDAGAYAIGGIEARVEFRNISDQTVRLFDIRPAPVAESGQPVTGAVFFVPTEGRPNEQIGFVLDKPGSPGSEILGDGSLGRPYFDVHTVEIHPNDNVVFVLNFDALSHAFSFNIALDYKLGDRRYTQTVTRNGGPWRASAPLCPFDNRRLSSQDLDRLASMNYEEIRKTDVDGKRYVLRDQDHRQYMSNCAA